MPANLHQLVHAARCSKESRLGARFSGLGLGSELPTNRKFVLVSPWSAYAAGRMERATIDSYGGEADWQMGPRPAVQFISLALALNFLVSKTRIGGECVYVSPRQKGLHTIAASPPTLRACMIHSVTWLKADSTPLWFSTGQGAFQIVSCAAACLALNSIQESSSMIFASCEIRSGVGSVHLFKPTRLLSFRTASSLRASATTRQ